MDAFRMVEITSSTIKLAFVVSERYGFGYYDSLMLACARDASLVSMTNEEKIPFPSAALRKGH